MRAHVWCVASTAARQHRRHHHVDADEQRVVPGADVQHHADRLVPHEARQPRQGRERVVAQRLGRQRHHGARAMQRRARLSPRLRQRLAHLRRDLARDALAVLLQLLAEALAERDALGDGGARPGLVRAERARDEALDVGVLEQRPLGDGLASVGIVDAVGVHGCSRGCGSRPPRANPIRGKMSMLQPPPFCADLRGRWSGDRSISSTGTSWSRAPSGSARPA